MVGACVQNTEKEMALHCIKVEPVMVERGWWWENPGKLGDENYKMTGVGKT